MQAERRRYRRPSESSYARVGWWTTHAAEAAGAVMGFVVGLLIAAVLPGQGGGWVPLVGLVAGALGLRWFVGRQFRGRPPS